MSIIGDGFEQYVKDQIKIRQTALGENNRNLKSIKAYSTKTPWIRLSSSVNLEKGDESLPGISVLKTLINSGKFTSSIAHSVLARTFILFGGVKGNGDKPYEGLGGENWWGGLYGFGVKSDIKEEKGFVPMPGITNVEFQYKNDGALATAEIKIKAFNRTQFQIIDVLYQRPGYTLLLEFGHSVYLNNKNELVYPDYTTRPFQTMFGSGKNTFDLHKDIAYEKEKWDGNYEAFFSTITKYNWSYNSDGSYDITVNLVGLGDVINSLKINTSSKSNTLSTIKKEKDPSVPPIIADAQYSEFNTMLFNIFQSATPTQVWYKEVYDYIARIDTTGVYDVKITDNNFPILSTENGYVIGVSTDKLVIPKGLLKITGVTNTTSDDYEPQVYITFGVLLAIIQNSLGLDSNGIPLFYFDFNFEHFEKDENFISTFPGHFSSNPNICIINYSPISPDITDKILLPKTKINECLKNGAKFQVSNNSSIGRLANIYIDVNFIAQTFRSTANDKGVVICADFLNNILKGVDKSLGSLNEFKIIHDKDTNLISILTETPLSVKNKNTEQPAIINTTGVTKNQGSFVRSINLNSELSDNFATSLAIGAQADGNKPQVNATAFSTYNKGLIDRILVEKTSSNEDKNESKKDKFVELFKPDVIACFKDVYENKNFTDTNIEILENINLQFTSLATGKLYQIKKFPPPFFLPFNLGLTMDGLSGMKIYQSFQIDGKVLPYTYEPSNIQTIIKSYSHSVNNNSWITKIETISRPIDNITQPSTTIDSINVNNNVPPPSNITPSKINTEPPCPSPISSERIIAMSNSYKSVFKDQGQTSGACARWTYNLALNYVKSLRGNNQIAGKAIAAGGNANQNLDYYNGLIKLNYTMTKMGTNISKQSLIDMIDKTLTWGYGDVIAYYANDGEGSHRTYGHTQIYVGDLNSSKWATSVPTNYGSSFPYTNRNSNKWDFYIFRAPIK